MLYGACAGCLPAGKEGAPMQAATTDCWDAQRWGLVPAAIDHLTEELRTVWQRYQACFQTQTHNGNAKAWVYLRG